MKFEGQMWLALKGSVHINLEWKEKSVEVPTYLIFSSKAPIYWTQLSTSVQVRS